MEAIATLKQLKAASLRAMHPNVPEYAIPTPKYSDKTANGLTRCIMDYIRLNGGYCVRVNTQGQYRTGIGWTKSTTTKGTPDITAIVNGMAISIEVKVGKDRLSEHQIKQADAISSAGGLYCVARNFEGFCKWYCENVEKKGGKHG